MFYLRIVPDKILNMNVQLPSRIWSRRYSTVKHLLPAKAIRSRFLEFFVNENEHKFIRSSPVASIFDPSHPFIYSGMCQFKKLFTGEEDIDCTKVANTQKCIRVSGNYNDLHLVGTDSYHHTFFEMLGNYSFDAYSKKEACKLAWELLTTAPYSIPPSRLFVTYFEGDEKLNLPADEEMKNIWLELGVSSDRILPFGAKENFWEMGLTGPCGACTEIHVALTDEFRSKSEMVNKGHPLLLKLWNIAFIKYNKSRHSVETLPKEYISTGMGFERLSTVLQGKTSNYDTDLFSPLFEKITELTGAPKYSGSFDVDSLDISYRMLADFSRLVTVAVTDNIFPDTNSKLKRILRKALYIAKYDFKCQHSHHLIHELSARIAEQFQDIFPEIGSKLEQVNQIVSHENKLFEGLVSKKEISWKITKSHFPELKRFSFIEYPELPNAFRYLKKKLSSDERDTLSPEVVHYLYDTYDLDQPVVQHLSQEMNFSVDWKEVEEYLVNIKNRRRELSAKSREDFVNVLHSIGVKTDDITKYSYSVEEDRDPDHRYVFPDLSAELVAIVDENEIVSLTNKYGIQVVPEELKSKINAPVNVSANKCIALIFDKSHFFPNGCGQDSDKGSINFVNGSENISFDVVHVRKLRGIVVHYSSRCDESKADVIIRAGRKAVLKLNAQRRLQNMRNHTISHLLSSVIKDLYPVSYLRSFKIDDSLSYNSFRVLGKQFNRLADKSFIEERLSKYISSKLSINKTVLHSASKLLNLPEITFLPGEYYPTKDIQVITIADENGNIISREPCGVAHLLNTGDVGKFNVVELRMTPYYDLVIGIAAGSEHKKIHVDEVLLRDTERLEKLVNATLRDEAVTIQKVMDVSQELSKFMLKVAYKTTSEKCQLARIRDCLSILMNQQNKINSLLKKFPRASLSGVLTNEIKQMKNESQNCVVYFTLLDYPDLRQESFKIDIIYRNEFPTMFFSYASNKLQGLCYVPENLVTNTFNAELWMNSVFQKHGHFFQIRKEEDMRNYCFMYGKFVHRVIVYPYIESLIKTSYSVAQELKG